MSAKERGGPTAKAKAQDAATTDDINALRARLEKLERFWRKAAGLYKKIAARAHAEKDHQTEIIMGAFAIAFENAAMHLYGAVAGSKQLKQQIRMLRRRRKR